MDEHDFRIYHCAKCGMEMVNQWVIDGKIVDLDEVQSTYDRRGNLVADMLCHHCACEQSIAINEKEIEEVEASLEAYEQYLDDDDDGDVISKISRLQVHIDRLNDDNAQLASQLNPDRSMTYWSDMGRGAVQWKENGF